MNSSFRPILELMLKFCCAVNFSISVFVLRNGNSETAFKVSLCGFKLPLAFLLNFPELYSPRVCRKEMVCRRLCKPEQLSYCFSNLIARQSVDLFVKCLELHRVFKVSETVFCLPLKNYAPAPVVAHRKKPTSGVESECAQNVALLNLLSISLA